MFSFWTIKDLHNNSPFDDTWHFYVLKNHIHTWFSQVCYRLHTIDIPSLSFTVNLISRWVMHLFLHKKICKWSQSLNIIIELITVILVVCLIQYTLALNGTASGYKAKHWLWNGGLYYLSSNFYHFHNIIPLMFFINHINLFFKV